MQGFRTGESINIQPLLPSFFPKIRPHQNPDPANNRHVIRRPHRAFLEQQGDDHWGQNDRPLKRTTAGKALTITYGTAPMVPTSKPVRAYIGNSQSG